ncbi:MAG: peptidoglycan DD-metalloendopeptidase family protein [Oscillospiraceae bacterium]|nr:peptidoglycan DD-metalloendopeptidase family protein [Oscillospiraceae bacterium]
MIKNLFLQVVNMSITASVVILVVIVIRQLLKKQPKIYSYLLWGIVLFRLLCPYSFSLDTSLFNFMPAAHISGSQIEYVPQDIVYAPQIEQIVENETTITPVLPAQGVSQSEILPDENRIVKNNEPNIDYIKIAAVLWLFGSIYMVLNNLISLYEIKVILAGSRHISDNIYTNRIIPTAFIMGIIKPKIYLPENLTEKQKEFILLHEKTHIRRCDYIFKILGFAAVSLHWFNPLVWVAFKMAENDMEMACDEAVIKKLGGNEKAGYSQTLLNISMPSPKQPAMHLAFGEGDTKNRIINILNYKKPAFIGGVIITLLMIASVTALAFNPMGLTARKIINLSDENIESAIILKDVQYINANKDDIALLMKNLKKIKLNDDKEVQTNTEDGYSYIMLSTETDTLKVNFNRDYTEIWLTGENGETNADNIVYDVYNPDYMSAWFEGLFHQNSAPKEFTQVVFPFKDNKITGCSLCENTCPFVVSLELPEGWKLKNSADIPGNILAAQDRHHSVSITNKTGDVIGAIAFNTYNSDIKTVEDICNGITENYGYFFSKDNYHILYNACETAVTEYTSDAMPSLQNFAIISKSLELPVYISVCIPVEHIANYQLEEIAQSIKIEPVDDKNTKKYTTFFIKPDESSAVLANTAAQIHLKNNLGIDDFSINHAESVSANDHSSPFTYNTDIFNDYDYVVKAEYSCFNTELTSFIYIKKADDGNYAIIGSVEDDMVYDADDVYSTYTETVDRTVDILPVYKEEKDNTMTLGTSEITSTGENGLGLEKVRITYRNGVVVDEEVLETITLREPVPIIKKLGTLWNGTIIQGGSGKLIWPTAAGYVSRGFVGQYPQHNGVDIAGPAGTYIMAADTGVVTKALYTDVGYGTYCIIEHGGYQTLYAHCSELLVQAGQQVQKGQIIAYMGCTGNATGNNLHFEVKMGNTRYNPYSWF